jgi:oxygen-independent coproporphyrinogen-3 oxidase
MEVKKLDHTLGIYIHYPFCLNKCPYCSFNSIASSTPHQNPYVDAVLAEYAIKLEEYPAFAERLLQTIYIGGGTPSLLSPDNVEGLIEGVGCGVRTQRYIEITIEVNPGTVDIIKLKGFKEAGVNRLSLGVQSFNDGTLKCLGRIHSARDAITVYHSARKAGFENIGVDLIFGVPNQTVEDWGGDVDRVIDLGPEHISIYSLSIEEGTPFHERFGVSRHASCSDEEVVSMYRDAVARLKEAGYLHYEISNLALPGFESMHNERYWLGGDYLGLGPGAHSYLSLDGWGKRWWNIDETEEYIFRIKERQGVIDGAEDLMREDAILEAIFLGLRRSEGIEVENFIRRFGLSPMECLPMKRLQDRGLIKIDGGLLGLTDEGLILSDEVFSSVY